MASAKNPATVAGNTNATVQALPPEYFNFKSLKLDFKSNTDLSVDTTGAKTKKFKANTPLDYVVQLQDDLKALKYLSGKAKSDGIYTAAVKRAVLRFQRHAKRVYRMKAGSPADEKTPPYKGNVDGVCDHATAQEIHRWITVGFVLPLGRFKLVPLAGSHVGPDKSTAKLREDAAKQWDAVVKLLAAAGVFVGGTEKKPYGDCMRGIKKLDLKKLKPGASPTSLHHAGRAVDINQSLSNHIKGQQTLFVETDPAGAVAAGGTFWRIWCKVGPGKGVAKKKGELKCFDFGASRVGANPNYTNPAGNYVDVTHLITTSSKFQRIHAQKGFPAKADKAEWWHFAFLEDVQETFLDEVELVGISEDELLSNNWTTKMMDSKPG
ncbi:MAG: peptidoglycan-binding domain-containing protein [Polyangiales bacterium]